MLTAGAREPARIQDPFGLRCLPPVAGALYESVEGVHNVLAVEINAGSENPLVAGDEILHHGGFHAATCALALEGLRLAMLPFASLSGARITHLMAPTLSGLAPFLSVEEPGSSGVLIAEYLAADALARLRAEATPSVLGGVAISRGLEEHASFAWQAALADAPRAAPPADGARARVGGRRAGAAHGRDAARPGRSRPCASSPPGSTGAWRTARSARTPSWRRPRCPSSPRSCAMSAVRPSLRRTEL